MDEIILILKQNYISTYLHPSCVRNISNYKKYNVYEFLNNVWIIINFIPNTILRIQCKDISKFKTL